MHVSKKPVPDLLELLLLFQLQYNIDKMVRSVDDKRSYQKVSIELRSLLVFRTIILQQEVRNAAKALKINYSNAKHIVQKRRNEYKEMARNACMPPLDFSEYGEKPKRSIRLAGPLSQPQLTSYRQLVHDLEEANGAIITTSSQ